jgi:hypothetical protein
VEISGGGKEEEERLKTSTISFCVQDDLLLCCLATLFQQRLYIGKCMSDYRWCLDW